MNNYIIVLLVYLACVSLGTIVFKWTVPENITYLKALKFMSIGFAIGLAFIGLAFVTIDYIMK